MHGYGSAQLEVRFLYSFLSHVSILTRARWYGKSDTSHYHPSWIEGQWVKRVTAVRGYIHTNVACVTTVDENPTYRICQFDKIQTCQLKRNNDLSCMINIEVTSLPQYSRKNNQPPESELVYVWHMWWRISEVGEVCWE